MNYDVKLITSNNIHVGVKNTTIKKSAQINDTNNINVGVNNSTTTGSVQIKMVTVSGSDGGAVDKNTYYVEKVPIQYQSNSVYLANDSGTIYMSSSNNIQKYTGEFSGSHIALDYSIIFFI